MELQVNSENKLQELVIDCLSHHYEDAQEVAGARFEP